MSIINLFDREQINRIKQGFQNTKGRKKSDIERIDEFRGIVSADKMYAFLADKIYEDVTAKLEEMRLGDCNKGTFGTLGCICGSYGMTGAAMLCSSAAYASGAGIVKCIIPDSIYPIMAGQVWEAVYAPLPASDNGTLRYSDMDKILGLEYGADDYMTKPFNILELKARIKAILRRSHGGEPRSSNSFEYHDLRIDFDSRRVFIKGTETNLTAKEFDLLELLCRNAGKVYSREKLLEIVWGTDYPGDVRTVDVHVRRLREKIEPNPGDPLYIQTKWGVGYFFKS